LRKFHAYLKMINFLFTNVMHVKYLQPPYL
jgi:hypothetical protein